MLRTTESFNVTRSIPGNAVTVDTSIKEPAPLSDARHAPIVRPTFNYFLKIGRGLTDDETCERGKQLRIKFSSLILNWRTVNMSSITLNECVIDLNSTELFKYFLLKTFVLIKCKGQAQVYVQNGCNDHDYEYTHRNTNLIFNSCHW